MEYKLVLAGFVSAPVLEYKFTTTSLQHAKDQSRRFLLQNIDILGRYNRAHVEDETGKILFGYQFKLELNIEEVKE